MTYYGDSAHGVTATVIILSSFAYTLFGLRVYTRLSNKAWGLDDWCMTAATIPFTALTISCLGGSFKGLGVHEFRLSKEEKVEGLKFFFLFEIFYCAAIIPIKLSISFMLMRIASGKPKYINSLYGVSAMFTIMNLVAFFYIIFHCSPVSFAWDTSTPGGSCNPAKVLADIYYATTAVNIVTDWFCAVLPVPLLWNVQLNRNAKISVGLILSLGALASLSACIRLVYTVNLTDPKDYLYGVADVLIWGYAENGVGMIVGCVATLRPLFRRVFDLGKYSTPMHGSKDYHKKWTGNSERPDARSEEWMALHESKINTTKATALPTHLRDSESEEHILGGGIKITQTIQQNIVSSDDEEANYDGRRN